MDFLREMASSMSSSSEPPRWDDDADAATGRRVGVQVREIDVKVNDHGQHEKHFVLSKAMDLDTPKMSVSTF